MRKTTRSLRILNICVPTTHPWPIIKAIFTLKINLQFATCVRAKKRFGAKLRAKFNRQLLSMHF